MEINFKTKGWSLIPGPVQFEEPLYSFDLHEIAEYDPLAISQSLLSFVGMELLHDETPSWYDWRARWSQENRWIELDMTVFDNDVMSWGGSGLHTDCYVSDLFALWLKVRESYPAVWLHSPDCRIYSVESFLAEQCT